MPTSKSRLFAFTEFAVKASIVLVGIAIAVMFGGLVVTALGFEGPRTSITVQGAEMAVADSFRGKFAVAGLLVLSALMLPVLIKLLAVVRSARAGDPFTRENGARLRAIGWLLLASYLIQGVLLSSLFSTVSWMSLAATPWRGLLPVLLFFVIAHIFDHGAEMRAELEGTV